MSQTTMMGPTEKTAAASSPIRPSKRKALESAGKRRLLLIAGSVLLWAGLCYGGYSLAHQYIVNTQTYIDNRLANVEAQNKEMTENLQTQIASVQTELDTIKEELAITGESISGTDKTKQALSQRITALDKQLAELKTSLKKLEETARAW
ncbi:hypothetical protein [Brevibacillus dissolubilis]|uniref:hypothetical protein n=1 Tax=Brevibacillus dissolubilis TaxID=1844116 RepID=UPI00111742D4|nr:hypothetical protein [Brevibacillus dissolubilis]